MPFVTHDEYKRNACASIHHEYLGLFSALPVGSVREADYNILSNPFYKNNLLIYRFSHGINKLIGGIGLDEESGCACFE